MNATYETQMPASSNPTQTGQTNNLVSSTQHIWVMPFVGAILTVAPGKCAVVTLRSGRRKVFGEGVHVFGRGYMPGPYPVRYVDVQLHRTPIPFTEALCKDEWRGGLALEVQWRVGDATLIVDVSDPVGDLITAGRAGARAVIETTPHDQLIGGMSKAVDADRLADRVMEKIEGSVQGIRILRVLITERRGDERRIQIVRQAAVERTRVIEEQELKRQKLSSQTKLVLDERELERERQELVRLRAETERKRIEEERLVRIREAQIEVDVSEQLLPTKWQQAQLEMATETNQQRHQQVLRLIEVYPEVFSALSQLTQLEGWGVSSRRRAEFELESIAATVGQGLRSLQNVLQPPMPIRSVEPIDSTNGHRTPVARIAKEVAEIAQLDGVKNARLEVANGTREYRVVVEFDDRVLAIVCRPEYPDVAPVVRWSGDDKLELPVPWSKGMSLKDIVQDIRAAEKGQPFDPCRPLSKPRQAA